MDILLVYATNSGGTAQAATIIADTLKGKRHSVTMKEAKDARKDDATKAKCIILGSPSWDYNGMEGQPLPEMVEFIKRSNGSNLNGKLFAVFGLGDSSYTYYCGAVTYVEIFIKRVKGIFVIPSLKVDEFFFRTDSQEKIIAWANELALNLH